MTQTTLPNIQLVLDLLAKKKVSDERLAVLRSTGLLPDLLDPSVTVEVLKSISRQEFQQLIKYRQIKVSDVTEIPVSYDLPFSSALETVTRIKGVTMSEQMQASLGFLIKDDDNWWSTEGEDARLAAEHPNMKFTGSQPRLKIQLVAFPHGFESGKRIARALEENRFRSATAQEFMAFVKSGIEFSEPIEIHSMYRGGKDGDNLTIRVGMKTCELSWQSFTAPRDKNIHYLVVKN